VSTLAVVITGGHADRMTDDEQPRVKNPFAIPVTALVADAQVEHSQLVTEQPHQQHTDWVPSGNDISGGGNGDGDGD
jgi:hypothetical protein